MRLPSGTLAAIALIGVVLYAGLLRIDALFKTYGPYERPAVLAALQPSVRAAAAMVTPDWSWRRVSIPYVGGDPINYLRFARGMQNFYAAHVREPGFPAATRLALAATGGADVAVSLASITFALLTLVATFALGCALGSPAAGLGAALALGIDRSAVYWSIGGWRDEMFAFFAVLSAWAWLRLAQQPDRTRALIAGVVSGGAILTRITSLSLLTPAVVLLLARRHQSPSMTRSVALAGVVAAVLAGPFLINCAIATGDPFYAINNHTDFYLKREGAPDPAKISAFRYTFDKFAARPIAALDTVATGVFFYPFANKWVGLNVWWEWLGVGLACFAVAGLTGWLWSRDGRLLLLMLLCGLMPFSVTWTVPGGAEWRLTLFAYAFQLLAAFWMLDWLIRSAAAGWVPSRTMVREVSVTVASIIVIFVVWTLAVPFAVANETLAGGVPVDVRATPRNRWFMHDGWSRSVTTGNVVARFSTAQVSEMIIPLPETRPYGLTLRLDPVHIPGSTQRVDLAINDRPLATLTLPWNPDRVGAYQVALPVGAIRQGVNRLTFRSHRLVRLGQGLQRFDELPPDLEVGFRLWYVLIVPQ